MTICKTCGSEFQPDPPDSPVKYCMPCRIDFGNRNKRELDAPRYRGYRRQDGISRRLATGFSMIHACGD